MTKFFAITAIVVLLSYFHVSAQSNLTVGIAGGVISPWTTNQNNYGLGFEMDYVPKVSGNGQLVVGYQFNKNLSIESGIGYAALGQNYNDTHNGKEYKREVKLGYLQVPLLFKYRTNGKSARFYAAVGPQFNFLMSGKQTYTVNGVTNDTVLINLTDKSFKVGDEDIKDRYESLDIMARLDVGVEISVSDNLFLNFCLTTAYGLMDINASDYRFSDNSGTYHPSHNLYGGINAGIHYVIPLNK